jgi:hypothetical protein
MGQQVINAGTITENGNILCGCADCQGATAVPNSVFEEHAGSKIRRPAQYTYLSAYNMSLKVRGVTDEPSAGDAAWLGALHSLQAALTALLSAGFATSLILQELGMLVNSKVLDTHIDYCVQCGDGGDLMCCEGCPAAYHHECLGLDELTEDAWFCSACIQVGSSWGWQGLH